jgi:DNA-binding response OmpR family regulator
MIKILLVEDTPSLAAEIIDILRMEQFEVALAINGRDALEQLSERLVNVIVSDLFMPDIDGFQLISAIRNDPKLKAIPIIILSARTNADTILQVKALGSDLFIQKPCDSQYLVESIKKVLIRKEQIHTK